MMPSKAASSFYSELTVLSSVSALTRRHREFRVRERFAKSLRLGGIAEMLRPRRHRESWLLSEHLPVA